MVFIFVRDTLKTQVGWLDASLKLSGNNNYSSVDEVSTITYFCVHMVACSTSPSTDRVIAMLSTEKELDINPYFIKLIINNIIRNNTRIRRFYESLVKISQRESTVLMAEFDQIAFNVSKRIF